MDAAILRGVGVLVDPFWWCVAAVVDTTGDVVAAIMTIRREVKMFVFELLYYLIVGVNFF